MGGQGSGNRSYRGGKRIAERLLALDVRDLAHVGGLRPGYSGLWYWPRGRAAAGSIRIDTSPGVVLMARQLPDERGDGSGDACCVALTGTRCHLGGQRSWFVCPQTGCGRRVAILYFDRGPGCRRCCGLAYASSRESPGQRATRRADRLRRRLGWPAGVAHGIGRKPKHMHWQTFGKIVEQHRRWVGMSISDTSRQLWPTGPLFED